jgi:membrane-bound lytic murein transglycosylase A
MPDSSAIGPAAVAGTAGDWRGACGAVAAVAGGDAAARAMFEQWFVPFAARNNDVGDGLFTGYYEPELRGSRTRTGNYTVPLYGRPADLITVDLGQFSDELKGKRIVGRAEGGALKPYPTRAEIEAGALKNPPEIVWVDDAVDAFFLQIQGSGRVVFEDGSVMRVGYAETNGRSYVAIGRALVAAGSLTLEQATMPGIRAWLTAHPAEAAGVMNKNPSFVFFRPLRPPASPSEGPLGAEGVPLTPGRSLAVDRRLWSFGLPVWLDAEDPLVPGARLQRLLVAQDTGGAIRGPVRGDVFWGNGAEAAERAGRMRSKGRYWILLPRDVAMRRQATN